MFQYEVLFSCIFMTLLFITSSTVVFGYIGTRWYRAPELLLRQPYGTAIDMWSLGCVLAELHTGHPIFTGRNELDQLSCIMQVKAVEACFQKNEYSFNVWVYIDCVLLFRCLECLLLMQQKNLNFGLRSLVSSKHTDMMWFSSCFYSASFVLNWYCVLCSIKARKWKNKTVAKHAGIRHPKSRPLVNILGTTDPSFLDFMQRCLTYVHFDYYTRDLCIWWM